MKLAKMEDDNNNNEWENYLSVAPVKRASIAINKFIMSRYRSTEAIIYSIIIINHYCSNE